MPESDTQHLNSVNNTTWANRRIKPDAENAIHLIGAFCKLHKCHSMKVAFVKVLEVSGLPVRKPNTHQILVKLSPANPGSYGALSGTKPLTCDAIWSFVYDDPAACALAFTIYSYDPTKAEVARVTLPLAWFPRNAVVTYNYPCHLVARGAGEPPWAKIQVHLSDAAQPAFQAQPGILLVKPAWTSPQAAAPRQTFFGQSQVSQFPLPPQNPVQSAFPRPFFPASQPGSLSDTSQPSASPQQQVPPPLRQSQTAPLEQQPQLVQQQSPLKQTQFVLPQQSPVQQTQFVPQQQSPLQQTQFVPQQPPVVMPIQQAPVVSPLQHTQYTPFMASLQVPFAVPLQQTQCVSAYGMPVQYGQSMGQYELAPQFAYGIAGQDPRQSQFVQYPMPVIGGGYPAQYIYPYAPTYVAQYPVATPTRVTQSPAPAKQDEQPPKPAQPPPPAEKPKKKTNKPKGSNTEDFEMEEDSGDVPLLQAPQDPSRFTAVSPGDAEIQDADLKPLPIPSTGREIDPSLQGSLVEDQLADSFLPQYPPI